MSDEVFYGLCALALLFYAALATWIWMSPEGDPSIDGDWWHIK